MNPEKTEFKKKLRKICENWVSNGIPSHEGLECTATEVSDWKQAHQVCSLWPYRPLMLTATIDDGIGQGLQIIECYAKVMGLDIKHLGLLQDPETIVRQCHRWQPDVLGLAVLQLDSDDALAQVGHNLPPKTRLIAGGPAFKFDKEMAARCKVDYVATNVAYFIEYLLDWPFNR